MARLLLLGAALASACATVRAPDFDELKPVVETFHQRVRWKDFRGAAEFITPEQRDAFLRARTRRLDERDLFITDFQLEDAHPTPGQAATAAVVSQLSWYRLPSTTEERATVTSTFVWRENRWLLESQDRGPFEELRPLPPP